MPEREPQNQNKELLARIEELERKISVMEEHRHLGIDGSKEFTGENSFQGKELVIHGAGAFLEEFVADPIRIYDAAPASQKRRAVGMALAVLGDKETAGEQVQGALVVGKELKVKEIVPANRTDFDKFNFAQMFLAHSPQSAGGVSGPSTFPPFSFLFADKTPKVVGSQGSITNGGSTLTDLSAKFKVDGLINSILVLLPSFEARKITSNTETVITVDGAWIEDTGNYAYQVITPIFLGAANVPFSRLYVGEDIRLGYGASGGTQVRYIKWGSGSPEGVITANVGSLFLRFDGGAGTTLYVKESGTGNTGWSGV